jgi:hypothetical protein
VNQTVRELRLYDFAATHAGGANAHLLAIAAALHLGANRAQIDVPAPLGDVMGVANVITGARTLAANLTYLCHDFLRNLQNLCCNLMILAE